MAKWISGFRFSLTQRESGLLQQWFEEPVAEEVLAAFWEFLAAVENYPSGDLDAVPRLARMMAQHSEQVRSIDLLTQIRPSFQPARVMHHTVSFDVRPGARMKLMSEPGLASVMAAISLGHGEIDHSSWWLQGLGLPESLRSIDPESRTHEEHLLGVVVRVASTVLPGEVGVIFKEGD